MTSSFTLLDMRMGMAWVIFAELAFPCLSLAATTTAVEVGFVRQRVLAAPWRSSNRSPVGWIVQTCFSVRLNKQGEGAVSYDPMSPSLWIIVFLPWGGGLPAHEGAHWFSFMSEHG